MKTGKTWYPPTCFFPSPRPLKRCPILVKSRFQTTTSPTSSLTSASTPSLSRTRLSAPWFRSVRNATWSTGTDESSTWNLTVRPWELRNSNKTRWAQSAPLSTPRASKVGSTNSNALSKPALSPSAKDGSTSRKRKKKPMSSVNLKNSWRWSTLWCKTRY